jgi:hypothetical protein
MGAILPASALVADSAFVALVVDESTVQPQRLEATATNLEALNLGVPMFAELVEAKSVRGLERPVGMQAPT